MTIEREDVVAHFTDRAGRYDRSSSWCTDDELLKMIVDRAAPKPADHVLDVACGTGLVAREFSGRVARVVGVDVTTGMAEQARSRMDEIVISPAESMPFADHTFDIVVCRQGIQFMTLPDATREMVRVLRPGGRLVITNLCAYGEEDRVEYFEVLRLRNPVRRHFFLPGDLAALLAESGCQDVVLEPYVSVEDVDAWSDNGAIDEGRREAVRQVYRTASPGFRRLHAVRETGGGFVDHMLFIVASGTKALSVHNG